jgi:hypothetical protein
VDRGGDHHQWGFVRLEGVWALVAGWGITAAARPDAAPGLRLADRPPRQAVSSRAISSNTAT